MSHQKKAVVFAGDYAYIQQIETALKSLCYHNKQLKIYIFNQDIPKEWFRTIRGKLEKIGSELIDVKLIGPKFHLQWSNQLPHINHMTFARYYVPYFVEEDVVLYLDSDLVVTGDISELFTRELGNHYVMATRSCFGEGLGFNAGVLLINNALWKEQRITDLLVETTQQEHENVKEGDQSILNIVFKEKYAQLEDMYNFQIGFDAGAAEYGHQYILDLPLDPLPRILHYISPDKPWNQFSVGRLRDVWWQYRALEWSDILKKWQDGHISVIQKSDYELTCLNLTNSYNIEQIDYLVRALPHIHFQIAAYTFMAPNLLALSAYDNVTLYPNTFPILVDKLMQNVDIYLDINHDDKISAVYDFAQKHRVPMVSFDNTQNPNQEYKHVFDAHTPEQMVTFIREFRK